VEDPAAVAPAVPYHATRVVKQRDPWAELISGARGPAPLFLTLIVASLVIGCIGELFEQARPWLELARLHPAVWERGEVWRLVTFGFVGYGQLGLTTVLQIACVFWLGLELSACIGERRTRVLLLGAIVISGLTAAVAQHLVELMGIPRGDHPFEMMQGQRIVLAICVASFAAVNREVNITRLRLLYGLTIPSRWLIPLQVGWALIELGLTRDVGGFSGLMTGTLVGWWGASRPSAAEERAPPEHR
jgi:hypothetical protein